MGTVPWEAGQPQPREGEASEVRGHVGPRTRSFQKEMCGPITCHGGVRSGLGFGKVELILDPDKSHFSRGW